MLKEAQCWYREAKTKPKRQYCTNKPNNDEPKNTVADTFMSK